MRRLNAACDKIGGAETPRFEKRVSAAALRVIVAGVVTVVMGTSLAFAHEPHMTQTIGEIPALPGHVRQSDIANGRLSFEQILEAGKRLFEAQFNKLDGQGRPAATGNAVPTRRVPNTEMPMLRTSGVDANACTGCHNQPQTGGGGEFVANVFVGAQLAEPVTFSVDAAVSDERNTLGMMGSGAIELLAREMTRDLAVLRGRAVAMATASHKDISVALVSKGVSFGTITARPDGSLDTSKIEGTDEDLIVKPFSQKGVIRSLREFTVNAMNHHHGMQSVERFGIEQTGSRDFDQDNMEDELSIGDITAVTIFQAALPIPGRALPAEAERRAAIERGEKWFEAVGCATCHIPALMLNVATFCEPYGLNPKGTFADTKQAACFDLTRDGRPPRLDPSGKHGAVVRAYTDLKRHRICDPYLPHFCNERMKQAGVPTDQFITRKLWDVGSSAPYGHRGDLTTITEAILAHGGEARSSRDVFVALAPREQAEVIEFLKSLQMINGESAAPRTKMEENKGGKASPPEKTASK